MCGPQWEHMLDLEAHEAAGREEDDEKWEFRGASSSVGAQKVNKIVAIYSHDHGFFVFSLAYGYTISMMHGSSIF